MNENGRWLEPPDLRSFETNRGKMPPELLLPYAGLFIAWSPDGTRVLASGESRSKVDEKLAAAGIHFSQVVHDYIDPLL